MNYARHIAYYELEGLKIYGLLTVPFGEMPASGWPAIVFNHGYIPPEVYRSTERYIAYVDNLARSGYIVFRIDYRGHDRSDGAASGAYGSPGYLVDVMNAVSALQAFPQADAQRIGMWGHSMGGFLTLRAMVISPDIKAGVIWAGVVASYPDLICCWRRPAPGLPTPTPNPTFRAGWRSSWQNLYGSPEENPEFWLGISANQYLGDLSGPVQLHHGTADTSVPVQFSRDLYQQITQAGKPVEYYIYDGDNHNLSGSFSTAMQRSVQFFDRAVAERWRESYDLGHILKRDWSKGLGRKLQGKIHVYTGDMDNYYLNNAVYLVEDFLKTADPPYGGEVDYGDRAEHCWNGDHTRPNAYSRLRYVQMFAPKMVERIEKTAPPGADTTSWRY